MKKILLVLLLVLLPLASAELITDGTNNVVTGISEGSESMTDSTYGLFVMVEDLAKANITDNTYTLCVGLRCQMFRAEEVANWTTSTTPVFNYTCNDTFATGFNTTLVVNGTYYGQNRTCANDTSCTITSNTTMTIGYNYNWSIICIDNATNSIQSSGRERDISSCECPGLNNDWQINMDQLCNITSACDLGTGYLNFSGSDGYVNCDAEVTTSNKGVPPNSGTTLYYKDDCNMIITT